MKNKFKIFALITASLVLASCQAPTIDQLRGMVPMLKTNQTQKVQESEITEDENLAQDPKVYQEILPEESEEKPEASEEILETEEVETEEDYQTKFIAGGDIMFHMNQVRAAKGKMGHMTLNLPLTM